MAQPFDNQKLDMGGEAVPIAEQISVAGFSASDTGVLTYRTGATAPGQQLTWFDREGKVTGMVGEPALLAGLNSAPALSPDEKRVAFASTDPQSGNTDIWVYEFARGTTTRFTFDPGRIRRRSGLRTAAAWPSPGSAEEPGASTRRPPI